MATAVREVVSFLARVYWRRLVGVVMSVYGLLAFAEFALDQFASSNVQRSVRLGDNIPNLDIWQWLVMLLFMLLVLGNYGGYRDSQRQRREISDLRAEPVLPAHNDQLHRIVKAVARAVGTKQPCDYGDPGGATSQRRSFATHFPSVAAQCIEWERALERTRKATDAFNERIVRTLRAAGLDQPPFHERSIAERTRTAALARARNGWNKEASTSAGPTRRRMVLVVRSGDL